MLDPLGTVLERADAREAAFTAEEVAGWPSGLAGRLLGLGLLKEGTAAGAVPCDACGGDHVEEPVWLASPAGAPPRAFITCPDAGRVPVPPERLLRWEVDFGRLATITARALGVTGTVAVVVGSRLWRLGKVTLTGHRREVFLARGLAWPDAAEVIAKAPRLAAGVRPVVLVAGRLPRSAAWPSAVPLLSLDTVLSWEGDEPTFDRVLLEGPPGDTPEATVAAPPAKRSRRMTLEAANERAMQLAKANRSFVKRPLREWAQAIGCSEGLVTRLPFWQQTMDQTGRGKAGKAPAPKAVSLTKNLEAVVGDQDDNLRKLIEEQQADMEPSPLDARRRKVRTRKRP